MGDQVEQTALPAPLRLERRDLWTALLLAGVLIVTASCRMYVGVCGQCHDDAIYVLNAKALAEGDGYRLTHLPGSPPQTKYPILYPAILAGIWKLWPDFPANLVALQGFSVACAAAFVALFYLYMVRFGHCSRGTAVGAALLCCTSPIFIFFTTITLAEMLFAVLVVAMLWWLETALRHPDGGGLVRDLAGGVLLALPFLTRSIGLLFVPLALVLLWRSRREKRVGTLLPERPGGCFAQKGPDPFFASGRRYHWTAVGAAVVIFPWFLWTATAWSNWQQDPIEGYYTDYVGWWLSFGAPAMARVLTHNFVWILSGSSSAALDGLSAPLKAHQLAAPWILLFGLIGAIGLFTLIADVRRGRPLAVVLACYLLVVCAWPWSPHRFMIPVLPFLLAYQLRGLVTVGHWLIRSYSRSVARRGFTVALATLVIANMVSWAGVVYQRHTRNTPNPELGSDANSWTSNQRLFAWLRTNSRASDLLAAGADPMLALYTDRLAYYPIVCSPASEFYGLPAPTEQIWADAVRGLERRRPRYLVLSSNFHGQEAFCAWVEYLRKMYPDRLKDVYQDGDDPRFIVYELHYPLTVTEARKP